MTTEQQPSAASEAQTESASASILERAITVTAQTPADTTKTLLNTLTEQALEGTVTWDKNLTLTIEKAIKLIDKKISDQLRCVLKNPDFQRLEGSWLGLEKLIKNSDLGPTLKIKVADYTKEELIEQFESAPAIDRSRFFNMVYQEEFGTAGGMPYGILVGDYEFGYGDEDIALLRYMGEVSATSHSPFISSAGPQMFDYKDFSTFLEGKPIAAGFESPAYNSWNSFRESDDSRYVVLTLPKTLARLPYGSASKPISSFTFEELPLKENGQQIVSSEQDFVWTNSAFDYALILNNAFSQFGVCSAIRGMENGGKVEGLTNFTYYNDAGELVQQCPTQVNFTDEREKELSDLGFLPLIHYKNTAQAVFIGAQTTNKPKVYLENDATSNAAISARIPYIMISSRIAHYLKIMGRNLIGSNNNADNIQTALSKWISVYVNGNALTNDTKAKYPLAEGKVMVVEQPGRPGAYSAVAYLRPWLQMEELTTSMRMVATIPG